MVTEMKRKAYSLRLMFPAPLIPESTHGTGEASVVSSGEFQAAVEADWLSVQAQLAWVLEVGIAPEGDRLKWRQEQASVFCG